MIKDCHGFMFSHTLDNLEHYVSKQPIYPKEVGLKFFPSQTFLKFKFLKYEIHGKDWVGEVYFARPGKCYFW